MSSALLTYVQNVNTLKGASNFFRNAIIRLPEPKSSITIRLDPDILKWLKSHGPRYQTRINAILRTYMEAKKG
ncbi:MAG: BrnA antitoxin family protein [Deltaproteobacteria bacterium]|nr:BrnA antitoxin family protein [Deltaproteobacteria bacterium]